MFPFLAPISYDLRAYRLASGDDAVIIRYPSAPSLRIHTTTASASSSSPTPSSRSSCATPVTGVSPRQSARNTPIPIPPEKPFFPGNIVKQRQKGLETSSAMKELFGVAGFSSEERSGDVPSRVAEDLNSSGVRRFGRKNVFERERIQTFADHLPTSSPLFSTVPDHDRIYEKCQKRVRRRPSQGKEGAPGPATTVNPEGEEEEEVVDGEEEEENRERSLRKDSKETAERDINLPGPDISNDDEFILVGKESGSAAAVAGSSTAGGLSSSGESADSESGCGGAENAEEGVAVAVAPSSAEEESGAGGGDGEMSVLIRGAQVVNDDSVFTADVVIQNGTITQVGASLEAPPGIRIIEASGQILMPAGIDIHTHFTAVSSVDDIARGTKAAVAGGTATVVETAWPQEGESLLDAIRRVKKAAEAETVCNIAVSGVITRWDEGVKTHIERAAKEEAVNSFLLDITGDDQIYQVLDFCRSLGVLVRVLPENKAIVPLLEAKMLELGISGPEGFLQSRPEDLEGERVSALSVLSRMTNCPVSILQMSSAEAVLSLQKGRESSSLLHAEVSALALATDGTHFFNRCAKHAASHLTDSPLRPDATAALSLLHLLSNSPLSVVASGHRAIASASRVSGDFTQMPRGVAAAEERMAVLWEKAVRAGRIDPMRFVALCSTNAAKILNLYPKKGRIAVGADGDVVLWEVSGVKRPLGKNSQTAADSSPFEGMAVHSAATATIVRGNPVWLDGAIQQGKGQLLPTPPNSPYLFGVVQQREKIPLEKVDRGTVPVKTENGSAATAEKHRNKNLQSSIQFGDASTSRNAPRRNPPGGRSTGFW